MDRLPGDPTSGALGEFAAAVAGDPWSTPLDEAALAMSAVLQPGLDTVAWLAALDEIAAACPTPTRDGIVRHLLAVEGFGNGPNPLDRWRASCLDRVIVTRRGLPITIGVVVIEVARRLGVPLVGIGMPAHFLVGDPADETWFVDPLGAGAALDRAGCRVLLERETDGRVRWRDTHLDAVANRAIIARMLNNLKSALPRRTDPVRHALVMRMRLVVPELSSERDEGIRAQAVLN
jgi:regulator of sirC expression with transglutaminase-like and TPR domain